MGDKAITPVSQNNPQEIIQLVLDGLTSIHSRRAYRKALTDFMAWYESQDRPGLTKATVQRYKAVLQKIRACPFQYQSANERH